MATRTRRRTLTDEERAKRREQQRELLDRAVRELLTSEGWARWVRTRAAFHRYSWRNTMLIAMQRPDASRVAGFRAWLKLNRCVRKGEKGIRPSGLFGGILVRRSVTGEAAQNNLVARNSVTNNGRADLSWDGHGRNEFRGNRCVVGKPARLCH